MLKIKGLSNSVQALVVAPVMLLALAGCGGSSDATVTPASSATGAPAAGGPGAGGPDGGGGFGGADFTAMQACLTAAGIAVPTQGAIAGGGARPSGAPRPSGTMSGTPPTDGVRPSGAAGRGGGGGMFQSAEAQAALKACGITMPTGRAAPPSATPAS